MVDWLPEKNYYRWMGQNNRHHYYRRFVEDGRIRIFDHRRNQIFDWNPIRR